MPQVPHEKLLVERRAIRLLIEEALDRADRYRFDMVAIALDQPRLAVLDVDQRRPLSSV